MRNGDECAGAADVPEEKNVDIDGAVVIDALSFPVKFHFQFASQLLLDGFDAVQDAKAVLERIIGSARHFVAHAQIEKAVGALKAVRLRFDDFGNPCEPAVGSVQRRERGLEMGLPVPEVASQREIEVNLRSWHRYHPPLHNPDPVPRVLLRRACSCPRRARR